MELEQQEFDKAFEAAMSDEELPVVVEDVKQVEETPPEAPVEEGEPERVEVIEGFTKEELKEHLALIPKLQKAIDTTNGTYGNKIAELSKLIESMKSTSTSLNLDALREEYPDIAERLAKGNIPEVVETTRDEVDVLEVVEAKLAEERATREQADIDRARHRLARVHPDFREIALYTVEDGIVKFPDPKFGNWLANQPKDKFDMVIGSKDADDLSDILTEYKKSLDKKPSLEAAILPKGNGLQGRTLTDKEIEDAAFAAEMAS
jgi:antitoxin component HigA of HigAB toxin-antitoxin module